MEHVFKLRSKALERLGAPKLLEVVHEFSRQLRERHPDFASHRAYYALVGARPIPGIRIIEGDFSGDDSVVGFLESLTR